MNKARRDAAGPHFFGVWNGRYLNLFYCLLIKCFRTILFFFCLLVVGFSYRLSLLCTFFFNKDEKKDDDDDISGRSGLNLPV